MSRLLLVLGLLAAVDFVSVSLGAEPDPADAKAITVKPGEEYVHGILAVPHADKRIETPKRPPQTTEVSDIRNQFGTVIGQSKQVYAILPESDFAKKRPKVGVSVYATQPDNSPLAKVLQAGDVVYRINGKSVNTPKEFSTALVAAKDKQQVHFRRFDYSDGWQFGKFSSDKGTSLFSNREVP